MQLTDVFELGILEMDEQHKVLIQMLQDTYDACRRGEGSKYITQVIEYLEAYIEKHFEQEEILQKQCNYPDFKEHRDMHTMYLQQVTALKQEITQQEATTEQVAKLIQYLTHIIENHMLTEDYKLAEYIKHAKLPEVAPFNCPYQSDPLTGLVLKEALQERVEAVLQKQAIAFVYAMIQVDSFEELRCMYGHEVSNEIIIYIGGILKTYQNQKCLVAQAENGMFLMYMAIDDPLKVDARLEAILNKVYEGFRRQDSTILITMSMGVARVQAQATFEAIECEAQMALSVAVQRGNNQKVYYDYSMTEQMERKLEIINKLQPHHHEKHLYVVYQPIYSVSAQCIKGCEALLRMKDDAGNVISPAEFIPIAEENGLIKELSYFCMNEVCKQYRMLESVGKAIDYITINLAIQQLHDAELLKNIRLILRGYGIPPEKIAFEMTESQVIENKETIDQHLDALRALGCKVLLDDFGTGYSALAYLANLKIDKIKIDKSFLRDIACKGAAHTILSHIIKMIQAIGLETVIEGVETETAFKTLQEMGVDNIQGYYVSRPVQKESLCATIQAVNQAIPKRLDTE